MKAATWGGVAVLALAFLSGEDGLTFIQLFAVTTVPPVAAAWVEGWWRERVHLVDRRTRIMVAAVPRILNDSDGDDDDEEDEDEDA
jgi:hypothetical protein